VGVAVDERLDQNPAGGVEVVVAGARLDLRAELDDQSVRRPGRRP
jgi:hypothetical protein